MLNAQHLPVEHLKRLSIFVFVPAFVTALSLSVSTAAAESYRCQIEDRYSRGWFPAKLDLSVDSASESVKLTSYFGTNSNGETVSANLIRNTSSKLSASYVWRDAPLSGGGRKDVRYSATLRKSDGRLSMVALVGTGGQRETARGKCVATK